MSIALPKELNYSRAQSLPASTQSQSIVTSPINASKFQPGSLVQFDLLSRGYLVPESLYIRYKLTISASAGLAAGVFLRATPVYTPFFRLELIAGSQTIESISQYNQVCNMLVNCKMSYSDKVGMSSAFGYTGVTAAGGTAADPFIAAPFLTTESCNGLALDGLTTSGSISFAAPLGCLLSNSDSLVPLQSLPSMRVQLTLDSLSNIMSSITNITTLELSNVELCYDIITFDPMVDQAISQMNNGVITIKSQSYLNSGVTVPIGMSGMSEYMFNLRVASLKSMYLHLSGVDANKLNGLFDSVDITSNKGDYQFFVAGQAYPQRALSTLLNKAGILIELASSFGPAHDLSTSKMSITPLEFNSINSTTTTKSQMGKFYVGVNTEKLSTNNALLTGISSQSSPISVRINTSVATTAAQTINLIVCYDALLQIDLNQKSIVVLQ